MRRGLARRSHEPVTRIGIDEKRFLKRHQYVSEETRAWITAAACLRPRVAGYVRRTTQEASEVDDLLAETWVEASREFAFGSPQLPDERTLIGHATKACGTLEGHVPT